MSFEWPDKDPNEILRYTHNWADRLDGETIDDVEVIFEAAAGLTLERPTSFAATVQTVWLEGGTLGENARLTLRCHTLEGQTFDEGIKLKVRAR